MECCTTLFNVFLHFITTPHQSLLSYANLFATFIYATFSSRSFFNAHSTRVTSNLVLMTSSEAAIFDGAHWFHCRCLKLPCCLLSASGDLSNTQTGTNVTLQSEDGDSFSICRCVTVSFTALCSSSSLGVHDTLRTATYLYLRKLPFSSVILCPVRASISP